MPKNTHRIVGIGEVLWDILPSGSAPGGAPANVIYHVNALGDNGRIVTRVGIDAYGDRMLNHLRTVDIDTNLIQIDPSHPTGTATVSLENGQPSYEFPQNAAWDFIEWNDDIKQCASDVDAVVFGTLAQRHTVTNTTIEKIIDNVRPETLCVCDVNLRPPYYTPEIIRQSLRRADIVKMNEDEFATILPICECKATGSLVDDARYLLKKTSSSLVCITRGERGSILVKEDDADEYKYTEHTRNIIDTVGAGDAFTAALVFYSLRGASLLEINIAANKLGAWVATCEGAMPAYTDDILQSITEA